MKNRIVSLPLIFIVLMAIAVSGCKKNKEPQLSTAAVTNIGYSSASSGGEVTSNGSEILTRGVCWSTNAKPTIDDNITSDGGGDGSFTSQLTKLAPNTTYYVRAYANTTSGTIYGNELSFTTHEVQAPCSPTKNTNTKGGQTLTYYGVSAGTGGIYWGDYGLSGSGTNSDLEISFSEPPTTGAYVIIDATNFINKGECVVSGVFGTTMTYRYNADGGDTVYVVKNGEDKYSMTFCGIELRRSFTDSFTSDGNLTTD